MKEDKEGGVAVGQVTKRKIFLLTDDLTLYLILFSYYIYHLSKNNVKSHDNYNLQLSLFHFNSSLVKLGYI